MTDADHAIFLRALIGPGIMIAAIGLIWLLARWNGLRRGDVLAGALGWGFVAMLLVVAGGVLYPPIVSTVAQPFVCPTGIESFSRDYSYMPGQQGVTRYLLCAGPNGEVRDITIRSLVVATLVYTLAAMLFSMLRGLSRRRQGKPPRSEVSG